MERSTRQASRSTVAPLLLALALAGCSDASTRADGAGPPVDAGVDGQPGDGGDADSSDGGASDAEVFPDGPDVPLAGEIEPGVWRELVTIDAPAPPKNPVNGAATPAELNQARFLRYRAAEQPGPVRAVLVCMPGMPAGAMAYDQLARRLIKLSGGTVELWAIDRRANLLEDLTGMQAAERARDPDLAWRYYDEGLELHGRRYDHGPRDLDYMSEWGLATAVADLRAVLALIPADQRRDHLVLVGHSFGAAVVQAYAAWELEGGASSAAAELAGLVLLDGGLQLYQPITEQTYLGAKDGLQALRAGKINPYLDYFGFGAEVFMTVELVAMAAHLAPDQLVSNRHTDKLAALLFLQSPPPLTAAAMVGFAIDDASSPMPGMRAGCGAADGPLEEFTSPLTGETRVRPADPTHTYGWLDHDQVDPAEKTPIAVLARVAHEGPTNRVEWYMPVRLRLDAYAVSALDVGGPGSGDWRRDHRLLASRVGEMDAPVLAVLAGRGLVTSAAAFAAYLQQIAPKVGQGRPRAGADRDPAGPLDQSGFAVLDLVDHAHDDVVHAGGATGDQEVYQPVLDWALSNVSATDTIVISR